MAETTIEQVRRLTLEYLEVDPEKMADDARFAEDLNLDSLDQLELTMALEQQFDIEIPDALAETIHTPAEAAKAIDEILNKKA